METDSDAETYSKIPRQENKGGIYERNFSYVSDVLSSFWLRCPIQTDNGSNWIVLGSRYSFL